MCCLDRVFWCLFDLSLCSVFVGVGFSGVVLRDLFCGVWCLDLVCGFVVCCNSGLLAELGFGCCWLIWGVLIYVAWWFMVYLAFRRLWVVCGFLEFCCGENWLFILRLFCSFYLRFSFDLYCVW